MAEKPGFNVASGFNGGVTVGINADNWDEFVMLCRQVWGEDGEAVAYGLYQNLRGQALTVGPAEQQAVEMLQSQLGAVPVDTRNGQTGEGYQQPPAQPAYQQQPPTYQQGAPAPQGWQQQQQPPIQQQSDGPPPGQTCDPQDPRKTKWVKAGYSRTKKNPDGSPKWYPGFWALP